MNLLHALRLDQSTTMHPVISFVGAGGKTTALFQVARQLQSAKLQPLIVTATTHLGVWQIPLADHHIIAKDISDLQNFPQEGVVLVTGEIEGKRTQPVSEVVLDWLHEKSKQQNLPLLIEADGSRQKPLKAPAEHEPPIPEFSDIIIYVTGLSALGKPLDENHVQRAERFSQLSGVPLGAPITPQVILTALTHPQGGLKNIPPHARRIALLNQADSSELRSIGGSMAKLLLHHFDSVLLGSLQQPENIQTFEPVAGIILAAGAASRYGAPKQLLDWKGKPFVRHVAETALRSGLEPVMVVVGFHHADVESALQGLPVHIVHNSDYTQGQSTSIKAGVGELIWNSHNLGGKPPDAKSIGAAVFLLADQPQIPVEVIRALVETHTRRLPAILAPLVLEEKRANPVLFDRITFPALMNLKGDVGGRAIFDKYKVEYIPWHDDILLFDVDKPADYQRLIETEEQ
ncbi:MAG: putative selenium-dependent hydroxylase accessory protein YqeC [Chloroflexi bacterium]|nr:putative selenium-dependent hydroxylase accessory protein YqeC [Chloroflexota bacterium]